MEMKSNQQLAYTVAEASSLISISKSFAYEMINCGKLRTIKIGRSRRITQEQLTEFLDRPEFKS